MMTNSIWHKASEKPELNKYAVVRKHGFAQWKVFKFDNKTTFYEPFTDDPDEIRWCYIEDLVKLADEKEHKDFLDGVYSFLIKMDADIEMGDAYCFGEYEIVDEPEGEKQEIDIDESRVDEIPEEYAFLTHQYVDQTTNGGYTGDEFDGYLYFPLPDGKYMKVYYHC